MTVEMFFLSNHNITMYLFVAFHMLLSWLPALYSVVAVELVISTEILWTLWSRITYHYVVARQV